MTIVQHERDKQRGKMMFDAEIDANVDTSADKSVNKNTVKEDENVVAIDTVRNESNDMLRSMVGGSVEGARGNVSSGIGERGREAGRGDTKESGREESELIRSLFDKLVNKAINSILRYESGSFSASKVNLTKEEARKIAIELIEMYCDDPNCQIDASRIANVLDAIRSHHLHHAAGVRDRLVRKSSVEQQGTDTNRVYRFNDLTGKRFGLLTVIEKTNKKSPLTWLCQCDCGNKTTVTGNNLTANRTKSCGCLAKQSKRRKQLVGKRFGKLTVLSQCDEDRKTKPGSIEWLCRCDCGNEKILSSSALNNAKSCGCSRGSTATQIAGKRFGSLVAVRMEENSEKSGHKKWLCLCDCGRSVSVRGSSLRNGVTTSCGCKNRSYG